MMKKTIAVIFGGKSAEHDVSILTAFIPIIPALQTNQNYSVIPIYISKDGSWYSENEMLNIDFFTKGNLNKKINKIKRINISFDNGLKIIKSGFFQKSTKIDIVFPAMHGTFGEDGSLPGLLRMANVPFVGCDLFSSAISMDKALTKKVLSTENISIVPFVSFIKQEWEKDNEKIEREILGLGYPLFVKPVHLGSSIAITKVKNKNELKNAIAVAFHYDDKVLVEKSIENLTEVTLPILGNNKLTLGKIEKPLNKSEFFDFKDKYISCGKKGFTKQIKYSEIPAKIEDSLAKKVNEIGKKTYRLLGCSGIARIDFLIDKKDDTVYVNEINTLPGSLYSHNWNEAGISNKELVEKLINLAEDKFKNTEKISYVFKSEILKGVNSSKFRKQNE